MHLIAKNGNLFVAGNSIQAYPSLFMGELDSANHLIWSKYYTVPPEWGYDAFLKSAQPAADSGYIIMGQINPTFVDLDFESYENAWVMRTGEKGDSIWQRFYGGSGRDEGNYICSVPGGGYIFIGNSTSFDGTLTSARTADSTTHGRVWICRIDEMGNPLWSRCFGNPSGSSDKGVIIKPTRDGGFICGANMRSSGYASFTYHGGMDIWLTKLNSEGAIQWARYYGGSADEFLGDIEETADGGFVFVGSTNSNNGDVSGLHGTTGQDDGWIVSLAPSGQIRWQRCIGSSRPDYLADVIQTLDKSFVAIGTTGFDRTLELGPPGSEDGIINNYSVPNILLTKVSDNGSFLWNKTFGGNDMDFGRNILQTGEHDYVISGIAWSTDGDIVGEGAANWVARLGSNCTIKGTVFNDDNSNGIKDAEESWSNNVLVKASKGNNEYASLTINGQFQIDVDTGAYSTTVHLNSTYFNVIPNSIQSTFNEYFESDSISFALQPITGKKDLSINIVPLAAPMPGFDLTYNIYYKNNGTATIDNGVVDLKFDKGLVFNYSDKISSTLQDGTLRWNISKIVPFDTGSISVHFKVKIFPDVKINDVITSSVTINPITGDETPRDNTAHISQVVIGSWDPNDKLETHNGTISPIEVSSGEYLNYTIRFQNLGNFYAYNIKVLDTLDDKLDWNTLEMVSASHSYSLSISEGNILEWYFKDIKLPWESAYGEESNGFISYRIKPKSSVVVNDIIHNTASIYFDFNPAVVTNDMSTIVEAPDALPLRLTSFTGNYFNKKATLRWITESEFDFEQFDIERSSDGRLFQKIGEQKSAGARDQITNYLFEDNLQRVSGANFYYRLRMVDVDGRWIYSHVINVQIKAIQKTAVVQPNPVRWNESNLILHVSENCDVNMDIIDNVGKIVASKHLKVFQGTNVIPLNSVSRIKSGIYTIRLLYKGIKESIRFVVIE